MDTQTKAAAKAQGELFLDLVKWERHEVGHSLGYLHLTRERLWFEPYAQSVLGRGFAVPLAQIERVERGVSWPGRGPVNVHLREPLHVDVELKLSPNEVLFGFEERVFESDVLRLFVGSHREEFLAALRAVGVKEGWTIVPEDGGAKGEGPAE